MKLLAGLYAPTRARCAIRAATLRDWDPVALRQRIGVIFQDFNRYQLTVGENIGAGDVAAFEDRDRWSEAAAKGQAAEFIAQLPAAYETQLGRWFNNGQELSGGQWQRIALARAFMRNGRGDPRARRADGGDGRGDGGADLRALPLADADRDRDPDLASLLDRAVCGSRSSCSTRAASSSRAATRSSLRGKAATRTSSICRRAPTVDGASTPRRRRRSIGRTTPKRRTRMTNNSVLAAAVLLGFSSGGVRRRHLHPGHDRRRQEDLGLEGFGRRRQRQDGNRRSARQSVHAARQLHAGRRRRDAGREPGGAHLRAVR